MTRLDDLIEEAQQMTEQNEIDTLPPKGSSADYFQEYYDIASWDWTEREWTPEEYHFDTPAEAEAQIEYWKEYRPGETYHVIIVKTRIIDYTVADDGQVQPALDS